MLGYSATLQNIEYQNWRNSAARNTMPLILRLQNNKYDMQRNLVNLRLHFSPYFVFKSVDLCCWVAKGLMK